MPRFACPGCGIVFEVAPEHVGRTVRCPGCGEALGTSLGQQAAGGGPGPTGQAVPPAGPAYPPMPFAAGPEPWPGYPQPAVRRLNPAGLASFLLGLLVWVGYIVVSFALAVSQPTLQQARDFSEMMRLAEQLMKSPPGWLGPAIVVLAGVSLAGLLAGILGLTRRGAGKGLAVTGLIIGALNTCCFGANAVFHMGR